MDRVIQKNHAGDLNTEDLGSNPRLRLLSGFVLGDTRGKFTTLCK